MQTTAPEFTLKTQDEAEWSLADHRGKNVVLMWYPLDWSPTCEAENCKISSEPVLSGPDKGAEVTCEDPLLRLGSAKGGGRGAANADARGDLRRR